MNTIQVVHRSVYDELELRDEELDFTTSYELLVASPGFEMSHSDRDFISFRGFPVTIITTEAKKKVKFKAPSSREMRNLFAFPPKEGNQDPASYMQERVVAEIESGEYRFRDESYEFEYIFPSVFIITVWSLSKCENVLPTN